MQQLPLPRSIWGRVFTARIISLLVLMLSLPAVTTAASITQTYRAYFSFANNSAATQVQIPIAGFNQSLGAFSAARIEMMAFMGGTVTFSCEAPDIGLEQRGLECGRTTWDYDPETGEWVEGWSAVDNPNYDISWNVSVNGFVFPQSDSPEPGSAPVFRALVDVYWACYYTACASTTGTALGTHEFEGNSTTYVEAGGLITDPQVFSADTRLMFLADLEHFGVSRGYWVESATLTRGYMDLTVEYDYAAVPEPDFKALTFLALLSMWLVTTLKRSSLGSTRRTTAAEPR